MVTGLVQERPTSITVDTGVTVSIVQPDMGALAVCEQLLDGL